MSTTRKTYSGREKGYPYSLSRWTDVVGSQNKWDWLKRQLDAGYMMGFNPTTSVPVRWSLTPDETLGLIFWTRAPENLVRDARLFRDYKVKAHMTVTGWHEVERGAPSQAEGEYWLRALVEEFGPDNVSWRFSPVPMVADVEDRFAGILATASGVGLRSVYLSFLQPNDRMPETRSPQERWELLGRLAASAKAQGVEVRLCNEDRLLATMPAQSNLCSGVCAPPEDFQLEGRRIPDSEGCGCVLMVDPFSLNEACTFGCQYCLDPNTPVLFDDFIWRELGQVKVGDTLIGFDEHPPLPRHRKYRRSTVEAVYRFNKPALRVVTTSGDVIATADHLWLTGRSKKRWKKTDQLAAGDRLYGFPLVAFRPPTIDYKMGYVSGMTAGDGTSNLSDESQIYWRVALADPEPLERLASYLAEFGIDAPIRPFDSGSPLTKKVMQKVETRSRASVQKILGFESESFEFARGFLAGLFDAEGSHNRSLRIHQTRPNGLLEKAVRYAKILGLPLVVEKSGRSARIRGGMRDKARFLSTINPSILRKVNDFFGRSVDFSPETILSIEEVGVREVIDIRTSTKTFIAGGLATHNCYTADKSSASHKRNTTKSLPIIQP